MSAPANSRGLDDYALLGRTGLRVSPLCLGAMTFGDPDGMGVDEQTSRALFDHYRDHGGNFIDTANVYASGNSERILCAFLKESSVRDRLVIATKFSISTHRGDPNAGGNGRKTIMQAIDASLRALQTDYVDLYWMHYWDTLTPAEEVIDTLGSLVQAGKILHYGLSDVPAWYLARAQSYAEYHGRPRVAAMQLEYSLVDRWIEYEHVGAARELGAGICAWSPLGGGMLTGKYQRPAHGESAGVPGGEGRLARNVQFGRHATPRNFDIVEAFLPIAAQIGRPPAQVALNWIANRPGVTSTIIGATSVSQLEQNIAALDFTIPEELSARIEEMSRPQFPHLNNYFKGPLGEMFRGAKVRR
jgi:aryl-alcohol dehydrogenase-like predicted oxidoreductase